VFDRHTVTAVSHLPYCRVDHAIPALAKNLLYGCWRAICLW